jgi:hypothetical protein
MDRLKQVFKAKYTVSVEEIKHLVRDHGTKVIDSVQIDQVFGGMRGIQSMIWETSSLDSKKGSDSEDILFQSFEINFRKLIMQLNHYQKVCFG